MQLCRGDAYISSMMTPKSPKQYTREGKSKSKHMQDILMKRSFLKICPTKSQSLSYHCYTIKETKNKSCPKFRDLKQQYQVLREEMDQAILEAVASGT